MKTFQIFILIFFASCTLELQDHSLTLRSSDYITYSPSTPCAGQEVTVTFDNGYGNNCGISRIQQRIRNTWVTVRDGVPQNGILTYSFIPTMPGIYRFRASWNKTGKDCPQENIKALEEDPLQVVEYCCYDYFTATAVCDSLRECPFGLEFHFMTTMDNWITIIGVLPAEYEFCGLYDNYGNIVEVRTGNIMEIVADVPACTDFFFYVYFNAPVQLPSFGIWEVKDMHGMLYHLEPPPCE